MLNSPTAHMPRLCPEFSAVNRNGDLVSQIAVSLTHQILLRL